MGANNLAITSCLNSNSVGADLHDRAFTSLESTWIVDPYSIADGESSVSVRLDDAGDVLKLIEV